MARSITTEIERRWKRVVGRVSLGNAGRMAVSLLAATTTAEEAEVAPKLFEPFLQLFDEAFAVVYFLFYFTREQHEKNKSRSTAFLLLVGRCLNLTAAIRHLVIAGFDQASRPLVRSLIENLDLAAVVLSDPAFAEVFVEANEETESARKFWRENVAFGKIHARAEALAQTLGLDDPGEKWFSRHRAEVDNRLSSAAHSSLSAARLSTFVPSLEKPGLFVLEPLGHISTHAASNLDFITKSIQMFGSVILTMLMNPSPPATFRNVNTQSRLFQTLTAQIMLLQSLGGAHGNDIEKFDRRVKGKFKWDEASA